MNIVFVEFICWLHILTTHTHYSPSHFLSPSPFLPLPPSMKWNPINRTVSSPLRSPSHLLSAFLFVKLFSPNWIICLQIWMMPAGFLPNRFLSRVPPRLSTVKTHLLLRLFIEAKSVKRGSNSIPSHFYPSQNNVLKREQRKEEFLMILLNWKTLRDINILSNKINYY